jgi:hypothetical protein
MTRNCLKNSSTMPVNFTDTLPYLPSLQLSICNEYALKASIAFPHTSLQNELAEPTKIMSWTLTCRVGSIAANNLCDKISFDLANVSDWGVKIAA